MLATTRQNLMTKYIRNSKTISGRLHDEMVMMDIDQGKYFSLNQSATRIWELLDIPRDAGEICTFLAIEFEVDSEQCIREVEEHIKELVRMGLVSKTD